MFNRFFSVKRHDDSTPLLNEMEMSIEMQDQLSLLSLPDELILVIASYLIPDEHVTDPIELPFLLRDLENFSQTCSRVRTISNELPIKFNTIIDIPIHHIEDETRGNTEDDVENTCQEKIKLNLGKFPEVRKKTHAYLAKAAEVNNNDNYIKIIHNGATGAVITAIGVCLCTSTSCLTVAGGLSIAFSLGKISPFLGGKVGVLSLYGSPLIGFASTVLCGSTMYHTYVKPKEMQAELGHKELDEIHPLRMRR